MRVYITFSQHDYSAEKAGKGGWTGTRHFIRDQPSDAVERPDETLSEVEMAPFVALLDPMKPARLKCADCSEWRRNDSDTGFECDCAKKKAAADAAKAAAEEAAAES